MRTLGCIEHGLQLQQGEVPGDGDNNKKYTIRSIVCEAIMLYAVEKFRGSSQYKPLNIKYKQSDS